MTGIDVMLQQPAAQAIGWALVQFIWQGALIGAVTAVILAALRRSAADVRYVVSTIALSVMLTMPVVTALQSFPANVPRPDSAPAARAGSRSEVRAAVAVREPAIEAVAPAWRDAEPASTPGAPFERWLPMFVAAWLAGVAMLTLRLLSGWLWVQRIKSHGAVPVNDPVDGLATRLLRHLHIRRRIRFLQSSLVDVPTVIGWLKPVVLLPASALAGLTPQQLEAVLAHELAHIRRHDYLVNLLQAVVETLLFYHPAVWWLSRRIRIERENCCDDLAVSLCGDPVTYASALAEMEGMRGAGGQIALAATGGSLLQRVRRLLGAPSHAGRAPGWLAAGLAVLVIVAISAGALGGDLVTADSNAAGVERTTRDEQRVRRTSKSGAPLESGESRPASGSRGAALLDARAEAAAQRSRPAVRERETRRCIQRIEQELPTQLRGQAHAMRGPCQALASVRAFMNEEPQRVARAARDVAAAAPVVVQSATEPITQVAAAIAEASKATTEAIEPVIAEMAQALEEVQRAAAATLTQASTHVRRGQKSGNFVWSNDGDKLEVSYRGDVEFTDDDADVRSLSPGGWLRIKQGQRFGASREIEFNADRDGNIQRRFRVGGSERPFEPEGRKWAAEMLPRFIRQSGIAASKRVARIHRTKGTAGVFAEIALIEGSWAKRLYYTELLKLPAIGARDVERALAQAGREIESDFELASLLISSDHLVKDDATRKAYVDAARTIGSDFEMRRVFSALLKDGPVAPPLLASLLDASTSIDSDFEEASLLVQVAKQHPLDATSRSPFFRALDTVGSAFERRRVLAQLFERRDLASEVLVGALESAALVTSDFERATVLLQFTKDHPVEGVVRAPFFKAVSTIDSAFERGRVLQAVARRPDASDETILGVIQSAQSMNSGFEKAQVLLSVASTHELNREGRDAYIDASQRLGDFEQGRVLAALVKNERRR